MHVLLLCAQVKIPKFICFKIAKLAQLKYTLGLEIVKNSPRFELMGNFCLHGNIKMVQYLLRNGARAVNWGALNAARGAHIEIFELLIANGAKKIGDALIKSVCRNKNKIFFDYYFAKYSKINTICFRFACKNKTATDFLKHVVSKVCENANKEIIGNCFDHACVTNNKELIEFMLLNFGEFRKNAILLTNYPDLIEKYNIPLSEQTVIQAVVNAPLMNEYLYKRFENLPSDRLEAFAMLFGNTEMKMSFLNKHSEINIELWLINALDNSDLATAALLFEKYYIDHDMWMSIYMLVRITNEEVFTFIMKKTAYYDKLHEFLLSMIGYNMTYERLLNFYEIRGDLIDKLWKYLTTKDVRVLQFMMKNAKCKNRSIMQNYVHSKKIVKYLVEKGFTGLDIALKHALTCRHYDTAQILVNAGAVLPTGSNHPITVEFLEENGVIFDYENY